MLPKEHRASRFVFDRQLEEKHRSMRDRSKVRAVRKCRTVQTLACLLLFVAQSRFVATRSWRETTRRFSLHMRRFSPDAQAALAVLFLLLLPNVASASSAAPGADAHSAVNGTEFHSHRCSAADAHPHHAILFFFVALLMGCSTLQILSRKAPWMPYTCVILVEGMLLAALDYYTTLHFGSCGMGILSKSIAMWKDIDPHLLLYAFLPALLFGDAMGLNIHLEEKCFSE